MVVEPSYCNYYETHKLRPSVPESPPPSRSGLARGYSQPGVHNSPINQAARFCRFLENPFVSRVNGLSQSAEGWLAAQQNFLRASLATSILIVQRACPTLDLALPSSRLIPRGADFGTRAAGGDFLDGGFEPRPIVLTHSIQLVGQIYRGRELFARPWKRYSALKAVGRRRINGGRQ